MKIPYSWLQEYVAIDTAPRVLAEQLTMAGLEVDSVEERWQNIVTAKIVWLEPIKGSDHLKATRVTMGSGPELSIVCGAPNISEGDVAALALPGAEFLTETGETLTIRSAKKMGVLSEGMLCSPRELGLSSDHQGIFLLPADTPLGQPLAETIIDLDIKAHRGDLFSVTGVAREVAAFSGQRLLLPALDVPETGTQTVSDLARVTVDGADLCSRFTARVIRNITIGPSPLWLVHRLAAAGMRSINNVVDITNYVMLEIGQPLHAFDYDHVAEHHLIVRHARQGETVRTLDDQLRELTPDMVLICDPTGPLSLAGVMGGATSEIESTTTNVLLEAATWHPSNIRRTSTRLGLRSEASSRYEKGLDPELARMGLDRAARLLAELAGGRVAPGVIDLYPHPVEPRVLHFQPGEAEWLLGYPVTPDEAASALIALEFGVVMDGDGVGMTVTVPTWRGDINESADLVEEIARMLGYDRIVGTIPSGPLPEPQQENWFDREDVIRTIIAGAGCQEVVTYPLTSRAAMLQILSDESNVAPLLTGADEPTASPLAATNGKKKGKAGKTAVATRAAPTALTLSPEQMPAITLANALSARQDTLRLTLLVSLLETLANNVHQGTPAVRIFEVGRRYIPSNEGGAALPHERRSLGVMLTGPISDNWLESERAADFFDLKAVAERLFKSMHVEQARYTPTQHPTFHPGRCALIELPAGDGAMRPAGVIGEVHPEVARRFDLAQRVYALEIDLERLFAAATERVRYQPISRFPALTRDIAVVVSQDVPSSDIAAAIREAGGDLVRAVTLFDVYEGESIAAGKRSLAYTIVYQAPDRTLSDEAGNAERAKVATLLNERFGATIRE